MTLDLTTLFLYCNVPPIPPLLSELRGRLRNPRLLKPPKKRKGMRVAINPPFKFDWQKHYSFYFYLNLLEITYTIIIVLKSILKPILS